MDSELSDSGPNPLAQAPAVIYPLSSPIALYGVLTLLLCLALSVDLAWLALARPGDWRPWAGVSATVLAAGCAWWKRPLTQAGRLAWDGVAWWWERDVAPLRGSIDLRLDTQSGLLIRFVADTGACRWFWLAQSSEPGLWLALRRAVHANGYRRGAVTPPQQAIHP